MNLSIPEQEKYEITRQQGYFAFFFSYFRNIIERHDTKGGMIGGRYA